MGWHVYLGFCLFTYISKEHRNVVTHAHTMLPPLKFRYEFTPRTKEEGLFEHGYESTFGVLTLVNNKVTGSLVNSIVQYRLLTHKQGMIKYEKLEENHDLSCFLSGQPQQQQKSSFVEKQISAFTPGL